MWGILVILGATWYLYGFPINIISYRPMRCQIALFTIYMQGTFLFYTRARPMPTLVTRAPIRTTVPAMMALPMNICA